MMIVRVAYIATSKSRGGSRTVLAGSPPVIPTDWTPVHAPTASWSAGSHPAAGRDCSPVPVGDLLLEEPPSD